METNTEDTTPRRALAEVINVSQTAWDGLAPEVRRKHYSSTRTTAAVSMLFAALFGFGGVLLALHFAGYQNAPTHVYSDYYVVNRNNNGPWAFFVGYAIAAGSAAWFVIATVYLVAPRRKAIRETQRRLIKKRNKPHELTALARQGKMTLISIGAISALILAFGIYLTVITAA